MDKNRIKGPCSCKELVSQMLGKHILFQRTEPLGIYLPGSSYSYTSQLSFVSVEGLIAKCTDFCHTTLAKQKPQGANCFHFKVVGSEKTANNILDQGLVKTGGKFFLSIGEVYNDFTKELDLNEESLVILTLAQTTLMLL